MALESTNVNDRKIAGMDDLEEQLQTLSKLPEGDETAEKIRQAVQALQQTVTRLEAENADLQKQTKDDIYRKIYQLSFGSNAIIEKVPSENGTDTHWVFRGANQRIASFFGRIAADLPGMPVKEVLGTSQGLLDALAMADLACESNETAELTGHLEKYGWNFQARLVPLGENLVAFVGMDISPRLRLEEEMRVFEALAENIPEGVAVADKSREIISMVSRYGRKQVDLAGGLLVDLPFSEIAGVWHVFHPFTGKAAELEELPIYRSMSTGEIVKDEEWLLEVAGGNRITILVHSVPVRDAKGAITGAVAAWMDITERKRQSVERERLMEQLLAEEKKSAALAAEAREKAEELETIVNSMMDPVILFRAGRAVRLNPAAEEALGANLNRSTQKELRRLFPSRDMHGILIEEANLPAARAARGETVRDQWVRFTDQHGIEHTVISTAIPLHRDGVVDGTVATWRDVTEREALQASLAQERSRLQAILECAPDGMAVTDTSGNVLYRNPAAERLRRSPALPDEWSGEFDAPVICYPDGSITSENDLPIMVSIRTRKNIVNQEMMYKWPDGNTRSILVSSAPIRTADGEIEGGVAVFQDITDRNRLAKAAHQRAAKIQLQHQLIYQREQERLKIAQELHDGPIQQLYGMVFTLRALEDDMSGRQALFDLRTVEDSLQGMARDMRQFCNELRPPSLGSFGLQSAIQSMADSLAVRFPELKITLDLDEEGKNLNPEIRLGLFRVCQELMSNAARHARARRLEVSLKISEETVVLVVRDDGQGFDVPADWMALAREGHLGLVGAQERVDALDGRLEISSTGGKGTTVRVTLENPTHQAQPAGLIGGTEVGPD